MSITRRRAFVAFVVASGLTLAGCSNGGNDTASESSQAEESWDEAAKREADTVGDLADDLEKCLDSVEGGGDVSTDPICGTVLAALNYEQYSELGDRLEGLDQPTDGITGSSAERFWNGYAGWAKKRASLAERYGSDELSSNDLGAVAEFFGYSRKLASALKTSVSQG